MKVAIMQPYLMPYIGYFDLMNKVDLWLVFDAVKYQPKSWMNRNKIRLASDKWTYFSLPIQKIDYGETVAGTRVSDSHRFFEELKRKLGYYKQFAPHYQETLDVLDRIAKASNSEKYFSAFIGRTLEVLKTELGIQTPVKLCSELDLDYTNVSHAGLWAAEICRQVEGATTYVNPVGGRHLFNARDFEERGIELTFSPYVEYRYADKKLNIDAAFSILDVLMLESRAHIKESLSKTQHDFCH